MEVAKKEMEQIKTLEEDLEKSMKQEHMYVEALENLQNEYDILETENNQLKKEASKREEKRQSLIKKANFDLAAESEDGLTIQEMTGEYDDLFSQLETLRASVRYLRAENMHLKSSDFIRNLGLLDSNNNYIPIYTENDQEKIQDAAREVRVLVKDTRTASATPKIIQLEHKEATQAKTWSSIKNTPSYQYQTQQSVLYTLKQRSEKLQNQISKLNKTNNISSGINEKV